MGRAVEIDNLGIPPLAGLCGYEAAAKPGLSVEETVRFLKRAAYVKARLNHLLAAHLPRTPEWEVKCALGLHLWLDAEHASLLRKRVAEMRQPPLGLDRVPDTRLEAWLDEAIRAEDTIELLVGVYRVVRPELIRSATRFLEESNPLLDYPSRRIFRTILQEEEEMVAWGEQAIAALTKGRGTGDEGRDEGEARRPRGYPGGGKARSGTDAASLGAAWEEHLEVYRRAARGIFEDETAAGEADLPAPRADGRAYEVEWAPRRDERFVEPFNRAGEIDAHYKDETLPYLERVMALMAKRLREMDVPEWMAPIVGQAEGKPWEYVVDLSRQLWDETRHAMMGEVGFVREGIPFYRYPVNVAASHTLNTEFTPFEAHAILWAIEQSLMARKTGKGYEWDVAVESGDGFATSMQDFDWADEVLHAQIGRRWLIPEVGSQAKLREYATGVIERWALAMDEAVQGVPQEDWWPRLRADLVAATGE